MRIVLVSTMLGSWLSLSGCGPGGGELSEVVPVVAAETAMKNFAQFIRDLTPEQRKKLVAIEQLYQLSPGGGQQFNQSFKSSSWSHTEWERDGRPRFDYLLFPNISEISEDEAILVATPRAVRIKEGIFRRVALTHSLKIVRINDNEFHSRILRQAGSLKPDLE